MTNYQQKKRKEPVKHNQLPESIQLSLQRGHLQEAHGAGPLAKI